METIVSTVASLSTFASFYFISEHEVGPNKVVALLNNYFDVMVAAIIKENGVVDKFIGDAIMAVFTGEFHLDRALDAALAIRESLAAQPEFEGVYKFSPKVSIGINSGEMVSGNIGSFTLRRLD